MSLANGNLTPDAYMEEEADPDKCAPCDPTDRARQKQDDASQKSKETPRDTQRKVKEAIVHSRHQEFERIMLHQIQAQVFMQSQTIFQADGTGTRA